MNLTPRQLNDHTKVEVSFHSGRLPSEPDAHSEDLLVIRYSSVENVKHDDISFMLGMLAATWEIFHPRGIVLDLRDLGYVWGDTMQWMFSRPFSLEVEFLRRIFGERPTPIVAIISDRNRAGFTSLVRDEMSTDPAALLFDSLESAVAALETKLK